MNELSAECPSLPSPPPPPRRRPGRPSKDEGPRVNYVELDQLLVFGEQSAAAGGAILYPSYRELAGRYGVVCSVIADYARKNRCQKRRRQVAAKIRARADERHIEVRSSALAAGEQVTTNAAEVLGAARLDVLNEGTTAAEGSV